MATYDQTSQIQPENTEQAAGHSWIERIVFGLLCLGAGLLIAYIVFRPDGTGRGLPDLLALAATRADLVELEVYTDDPEEAESYIVGEFGWPVDVPRLPHAALVGVGVDEIAQGVELPVLRYHPDGLAPITVYVYDYAFLDDAAGRLQLANGVYARLAEDDAVDVRRTN
ncbi:MAG: hypothetical protein R3284_02570, partial [Rubricoccaceae bacterium]|nr:hypothetical protein [Rubricoccaceae bacterium]